MVAPVPPFLFFPPLSGRAGPGQAGSGPEESGGGRAGKRRQQLGTKGKEGLEAAPASLSHPLLLPFLPPLTFCVAAAEKGTKRKTEGRKRKILIFSSSSPTSLRQQAIMEGGGKRSGGRGGFLFRLFFCRPTAVPPFPAPPYLMLFPAAKMTLHDSCEGANESGSSPRKFLSQ